MDKKRTFIGWLEFLRGKKKESKPLKWYKEADKEAMEMWKRDFEIQQAIIKIHTNG